jgi:hypothetical protein
LSDALLVTPNMALDRSRRLLEARGWIPDIVDRIGPWTLIRVRPPPDGRASGRLYWTEYGVFLAESWFDENPPPEGWISLLAGPVRFGHGVELEAILIESARGRPGEEVRMLYRWRCPPKIQTARWAFFVHFRHDDKIRFQDDHVWLGEIAPTAIRKQPDGWVFQTERRVRPPDEAPPGTYTIRLGLYDRMTEKRLRPRGNITERHRAVVLSDVFMLD